MATAADWMSAASFISMAGLIAFLGYDGSVYLMGWTGGYVLLALFLAPYLRKFGKFTVPEFIAERYYSKTARIVAVICLIFVSFTYVAGQMRGVGIVFSRFLEVDVTIGLIIGMGIVFIYAVLGGMKGITYTQVAQYCVLIFRLHGTGDIHRHPDYRQPCPAARLRQRSRGYQPARQARRHRHVARLYAVHKRSEEYDRCLLYHAGPDGRHRRPAACYRAFFHGAARQRCTNVGRLRVAVYRHPVYDSARRWCDGALQPDQHDAAG